MNILFFGSSSRSEIVRQALIKAGYALVSENQPFNLMVSADYGTKLPPGGLNLHPSLLPKYRGPTPVPQQILDGANQSGITIIKMTDKFDAGPIVAQQAVPIQPDDTSLDLLNRCFSVGAKLLVKILPDYLNTKITLKIQDEAQATYTRKFTKADGFINWEDFKTKLGSIELDRRIRALYPWPGVWTKLPKGKILKLLPKNQYQIEGKQPISFTQFKTGYL